jgi:hypothetical protein
MTVIFVFSTFGIETFFSASPVACDRYFEWTGAGTGAFLTGLALLILPVVYFCERIARRYEERTVVKNGLLLTGAGLFLMLNWESLFSLIYRVPALLTDLEGREEQRYDWRLGLFQYTIGLSIVFAGLVSLQSASLALLSKTSPMLRSFMLNFGTITTFLFLGARFAADTQIIMVDLSHKLINTDLVNSLAIPLLICCVILMHVVKKRYFSLM